MATQTISLFPRIQRVLQSGDSLIADVDTPSGVITMRVDASDLFGGVAGALQTLSLVVKALSTPSIQFDQLSSVSTDGQGNVTHTAKLITLAGQIAFTDLVDTSNGNSPEPPAGSLRLFVNGGYVKCAT